MRATIWGCRGSVPTPGAETVRYGGNTSCVEVALDDGTVLVLDAGTGIRQLGLELAERGTRRVHLLLTHLHLDHLEGLRFFAPLWDEGVELHVWGPPVAAGVDVLLHDAQYFEDEYEARIGWGHSSVADAVAFTRTVGARRL